jgi:hypothetical protein
MTTTGSHGVRKLSSLDCPGGGQVVVDGKFAYIGHMEPGVGTSIADVSDPSNPRLIANVPVAAGFHSHKVRASNGLMLVNRELVDKKAAAPGARGGLGVYDVSNPSRPREIRHWSCDGTGVHRFTFDGRYAYLSPELDGFIGNIVLILDLADPEKPQEVGRWWLPGQWIAGGETPSWEERAHRCHHPIRFGDRLFVSYWHGGIVILDISDMSRPKMVSRTHWSPPFPWPSHSAVPIPQSIHGRRWMIVADEDVDRLRPDLAPEMSAFIWFVDITDETHPIPVSSFQVEGLHGRRNPNMTGCHQPVETIVGTEVPVAWFSQGLRIVDFSDPMRPRQAAYYLPETADQTKRVSSNDVFVDARAHLYLIDRIGGLTILERI